MKHSLIVAASERGVIGLGGTLPWRIPADLRRFKQITMGHGLIMGRRTFDSIGRPLPGRTTVVVTSRPMTLPQSVPCASNVLGALRIAEGLGCDEVFFAGGAKIYEVAVPMVSRIYLTRVHGDVEGDVVVPMFARKVPTDLMGEPGAFVEVGEPETVPSEGSTHAATFHIYDRVR